MSKKEKIGKLIEKLEKLNKVLDEKGNSQVNVDEFLNKIENINNQETNDVEKTISLINSLGIDKELMNEITNKFDDAKIEGYETNKNVSKEENVKEKMKFVLNQLKDVDEEDVEKTLDKMFSNEK